MYQFIISRQGSIIEHVLMYRSIIFAVENCIVTLKHQLFYHEIERKIMYFICNYINL